MFFKNKKFFLVIVAFLTIGTIFFGANLFWAQSAGAVKDYGQETARQVADLQDTVAGAHNIMELVGVIIGLALSVVAAVFFILILYAGGVWMTAMGNSERVSKAKETLETSAIGLVIVLSAYAIANFVFNALNKTSL